MSNGVAKIIGPRAAREVDLLGEFYDQWLRLHELRHQKAERQDLEQAAQELLEAHVAITTYRKRNDRTH